MDMTIYSCPVCHVEEVGKWELNERHQMDATHPMVIGPRFREQHRHGYLMGFSPVEQRVLDTGVS